GGFEISRAVLVPDDGVRVHDIFQEVIQIRTLGAGQLRTDPPTFAEQRMTRGAGAVEQSPAARSVGGLQRFRGDQFLVAGDKGGFVLGYGTDAAQGGGHQRWDARVFQRQDLPRAKRRDVPRGNRASLHGVQEREAVVRAGSQG